MNDPLRALIAETAALRQDLEDRRQRYFQLFVMGAPMTWAATCAIAALTMEKGVFPWPVVLVVSLAGTAIGFQIVNALYRAKTKSAFLARIAAAMGLRYEKRGIFPLEDLFAHKIIPPHDRHKIEDGFSGTINGVDLAFEEAVLTDCVRTENNQEREEIVFWGLLIKIRIGKKLESHTVVLPRNATMMFFRTMFSSFERVKLVSPKFEESFNVMSTSQVEARYVLDPAFMERFLDAGKLLGSRWMEASFQGQEIAFAVQRNRPMFEIGWLFRPLTEKSLENVVAELKAVIGLIEALKLNPHTGLGAEKPVIKPALPDSSL